MTIAITSRVKIARGQLDAQFDVATYDPEQHTIDACWTTGARGLRYDWWSGTRYYEELEVSEQACELSRLNNHAAVLNSHKRHDLSCVLGVVERAWIQDGKGLATIRFSQRPDVAPYEQDVATGILRKLSCAYDADLYEKVGEEDGIPILRCKRWAPDELSFVPVAFDDDANTRALKARAQEDQELFEVEVRTADRATPEPVTAPSGARQEESHMTTPALRGGNATPAQNPPPVPAVPATRADMECCCPSCNTCCPAGATFCPHCGSDVSETTMPGGGERAATGITITRGAGHVDRNDVVEILSAVRTAKLPQEFGEQLIREGKTLDQARAAIIAEWGKRDVSTVSSANLTVTRAEADTRRDAMGAALRLRANPIVRLAMADADHRRLIELAHPFRGMTLIDMARECIEAAGGKWRGLSRREIAQAALNLDRGSINRAGMHTVSDFDNILGSNVHRSLQQMYELAPRTFTAWARKSTIPDFRNKAVSQLSEMPAFSTVNEGGEYKYLSISDKAETYSLAKYGGIIAISWESIVNDDLSAFDRLPRALAEEAAATESDVVYGILSTNAALSDSVALFHATHANLAAVGTAINVANLTAGRAAMRKQTGPKSRKLNIVPRTLLVGPDKEGEANEYTSANYVANQPSAINPSFNTSLEVVVEARISGNQWYLAADPGRIDTIEFAYLEGEEGLFTEQRTGFNVDGLEIKGRLAFAAKAIDYRGLYSNPGA